MKIWLLMTSVACTALVGPHLALSQTTDAAQKSDAGNPSPLASTTQGQTLPEVVVTARKVSERLQSVPVSVTSLGSTQLKQQTIQTVQDIQFHTPGLVEYPEPQGSAPDFAIRGARQQGVIGSQGGVAVYLGYVPVVSTYSVAYSTYDMQSVDVLKGPQGTLFGKNTTGGAIIFTPAKPTHDFSGSLLAGYGNYDRKEFNGYLNLPISDTLALRVAGNYVDHDGYTKNISGPNLDAETYSTGRAILSWTPVAQFDNELMFDYVHALNRPTQGKAVSFGGPCFLYANCQADGTEELSLGPRKTDQPFDQYAHVVDSGVTDTATLDLGFTTVRNIFGYRRDTFHDFGNDSVLAVPLLGVKDDNHDHQLTNETDVLGHLFDRKLDYNLGIYYSSVSFVQHEFNTILPPTATGGLPGFYHISPVVETNTFNTQEIAGFGQVSYHLDSKFTVTAGARYNSSAVKFSNQEYNGSVSPTDNSPYCATFLYSDIATEKVDIPGCRVFRNKDFPAFTYNVSLNYQADASTLIYGSVARGYQAGGFNTQIEEAQYRTFKPETVESFEAGLKKDWRLLGGPIRTNVDFFYATYNNQQRVENGAYPTGNSFIATFNAASSTEYGTELEVSYLPTDRISISGFYSYLHAHYNTFNSPVLAAVGFQQAVDLSGDAIAAAPEHTLSVTGAYSYPIKAGNLRGSVTGYYRSSTYSQDLIQTSFTHLNGFALFNARLDLVNVLPVNVGFWVNNLFDSTERIFGADNNGTLGYASEHYVPPRTFGAEVSYKF